MFLQSELVWGQSCKIGWRVGRSASIESCEDPEIRLAICRLEVELTRKILRYVTSLSLNCFDYCNVLAESGWMSWSLNPAGWLGVKGAGVPKRAHWHQLGREKGETCEGGVRVGPVLKAWRDLKQIKPIPNLSCYLHILSYLDAQQRAAGQDSNPRPIWSSVLPLSPNKFFLWQSLSTFPFNQGVALIPARVADSISVLEHSG